MRTSFILICWFNAAFEEITKSSSPEVLNGLNDMRGGVDLVLSRILESYSPGEMAGLSHLLRKGMHTNVITNLGFCAVIINNLIAKEKNKVAQGR